MLVCRRCWVSFRSLGLLCWAVSGFWWLPVLFFSTNIVNNLSIIPTDTFSPHLATHTLVFFLDPLPTPLPISHLFSSTWFLCGIVYPVLLLIVLIPSFLSAVLSLTSARRNACVSLLSIPMSFSHCTSFSFWTGYTISVCYLVCPNASFSCIKPFIHTPPSPKQIFMQKWCCFLSVSLLFQHSHSPSTKY